MREGQGSQEVRAGGPRGGQERRLSLAGRGAWLDLWLSLCERAPEEKDADPTEALRLSLDPRWKPEMVSKSLVVEFMESGAWWCKPFVPALRIHTEAGGSP